MLGGRIEERAFMGGVGFFVDGHLVVGVIDDALCVRVADDEYDHHLGLSAVGPFQFAGRPVAGWLTVAGAQLDDEALASWIEVAEAGWRAG